MALHQRKMPAMFAALVLMVFCSFQTACAISVMSVDLGNEFVKIAIVSPGKPMEIILNTDSARKTPNIVAFRDGERFFGEAAVTTATRFPEKSFGYLMDIIGKPIDSPLVQLYQKRFSYLKISADEVTGTILLHHPDGTQFTPEELLGMLLQQCKSYAEIATGDGVAIHDIVITVPPYFTQAERRSVLRSADLAGLKVLQLLNSNTAVALNYGIFRTKDFSENSTTNILFIDMGSTATVATVAGFQIIKTKERGFTERVPQLQIRGVGYDRTLGGFEMQLRLRDLLAKRFAEQRKIKLETVVSNKRAMAKLLKEAGRMKRVLSANTEHTAQVENVMDDKDLKAPVSRQEFEDLCADLLTDRLQAPIQEALTTAGLVADDINQVIVFGGNSRVPKVQELLSAAVGGKDLGRSVNSDEAAAMGAAYQAAVLSKGFKVKAFTLKDVSLFPIQVDFSREVEQDDGSTKVKLMQRTLFIRNNAIPQKKVLTFSKHSKDFDFFVNYGDMSGYLSQAEIANIGSHNLTRATVAGISDALSKHNLEEEESKGIKAHFRIDESGILNLEQVEAVFEKKVEEVVVAKDGNVVGDTIAKLGSTLSKLFGSGAEEAAVNDTETIPEQTANATASESPSDQAAANETAAVNATASDGNQTTAGAEVRKEIKIKTLKEPLKLDTVRTDLKEIAAEEMAKSRKKLTDFNLKDLERNRLDSLRNSLESFITETKMKLFEKEYESASTEAEREKLTAALNAASEWLEYESDKSSADEFQSKLSSLKTACNELFERVREHTGRPDAVKALNDMLNISSLFLGSAKNLSADQQIFTEVEINTLEKLVTETSSWLNTSLAEQSQQALSAPPKITIKQIAEKIGGLDREVKYLVNKLKITPPKKKVEPKPEKKEEKAESGQDVPTENEVQAEEESSASGNSSSGVDETTTESVPGATPAQQEQPEGEKVGGGDGGSTDEHSVPDPTKPVTEKPHTEL